MACNKQDLWGYLSDFGGRNPLDAVICPFVQGAGMGESVFALFVLSSMGLALTVRAQHPAPIVISLMLSAGLFATALPGGAIQIAAVVILITLAGAGLVIYQRSQRAL